MNNGTWTFNYQTTRDGVQIISRDVTGGIDKFRNHLVANPIRYNSHAYSVFDEYTRRVSLNDRIYVHAFQSFQKGRNS